MKEVETLLNDVQDKHYECSDEMKVLKGQARHLCDTILPLMSELRLKVDEAEDMCDQAYWPYPSYLDILYGHHNSAPVRGADQTSAGQMA